MGEASRGTIYRKLDFSVESIIEHFENSKRRNIDFDTHDVIF